MIAKHLEAAAHHEAGHAVVAWKLGIKFRHVTIKADHDSLGHVLFQRMTSNNRLQIERHIIIDFAGQLAEARFREKHPRYGMHDDNQRVVVRVYKFCISKEAAESFLRYSWFMSRDLVNLCWAEIQPVARALLERQTLRLPGCR
jgi:hypothetical protein